MCYKKGGQKKEGATTYSDTFAIISARLIFAIAGMVSNRPRKILWLSGHTTLHRHTTSLATLHWHGAALTV
jgi:hypothetical protein